MSCSTVCAGICVQMHVRAHARAHTHKECCTSVILKHLQQYIAEGDVFLCCIVPADEMWCHRKPVDNAVEIMPSD